MELSRNTSEQALCDTNIVLPNSKKRSNKSYNLLKL